MRGIEGRGPDCGLAGWVGSGAWEAGETSGVGLGKSGSRFARMTHSCDETA